MCFVSLVYGEGERTAIQMQHMKICLGSFFVNLVALSARLVDASMHMTDKECLSEAASSRCLLSLIWKFANERYSTLQAHRLPGHLSKNSSLERNIPGTQHQWQSILLPVTSQCRLIHPIVSISVVIHKRFPSTLRIIQVSRRWVRCRHFGLSLDDQRSTLSSHLSSFSVL